jgi:hypothetical protein
VKTTGLLVVSTDFFTAAADVRDGIVINAAPILRWTVGRHASVLANYGRRQKARMTWMPY